MNESQHGTVGTLADLAHSDLSLMLRYQRGDRRAFAELVRAYEHRLFTFMRHQVGTRAHAEELSAKTFLCVAERASQFKQGTRFSTWLFGIACELVRELSPAEDLAASEQDLLEPASREIEPESAGGNGGAPRRRASQGVERSVLQVVRALPREIREVYLLRELGDVPFKDIAAITLDGDELVRERMRRALQLLQAPLSKFEEYTQASVKGAAVKGAFR